MPVISEFKNSSVRKARPHGSNPCTCPDHSSADIFKPQPASTTRHVSKGAFDGFSQPWSAVSTGDTQSENSLAEPSQN